MARHGDLSGNYNAPTVSGLQGIPINGIPASGQVLAYNGTNYVPTTLSGSGSGSVTSVTSSDSNLVVANSTTTPVLNILPSPIFQNLYVNNTTSGSTVESKTTATNQGAYVSLDSTSDSYQAILGKVNGSIKWTIGRSGNNAGFNIYTNFSRAVLVDDTQNTSFYGGVGLASGKVLTLTGSGAKVITPALQLNTSITPVVGQAWVATDTSGNGAWGTISGSGGSSLPTQTTTKTGAYTANPGELVIVDGTSSAFTVTLPTTPADRTLVEVKRIDNTTANLITVVAGGTDTFTSGVSSLALNYRGHAIAWQYNLATTSWTGIYSDNPLNNLYLNNTTGDVSLSVKSSYSTTAGAYVSIDSTSDSYMLIQGKQSGSQKWAIGRSGVSTGLHFYSGFTDAFNIADTTYQANFAGSIVLASTKSLSLSGSGAKITTPSLQINTATAPTVGQVWTASDTSGNGAWSTAPGAGTGGSGTVTTVSVTSANGLAGTVTNPTTTPAITLTTSVTGLLKGNGTAISAASAGTDYQVPISLTTTGTSGAATFSGGTLNIPSYTAGSSGLTQTATQTSPYTASPSDFVIVDATSGAITITLPTTPADKTTIGVKKIDSTTAVVTVAAGGSDVFMTSGASTATLLLPGQASTYQYNATAAKWTGISNDVNAASLQSTSTVFQNLYALNTAADVTMQAKTSGSSKGAYLVVDSTSSSAQLVQGKVNGTQVWAIGRTGPTSGLHFYNGFTESMNLADTTLAATFLGDVNITTAKNLVFGTTGTGTMIGNSTTNKFAFWGSTPIVQPTGDIKTALSALGLIGTPTLSIAGNISAGTNVTITGSGTTAAPYVINSASGSGGTTSPLTTKGDLWGYDTANNRIPVGTDGYALVADSTQALGVKWAATTGTGNMSTSTYDPAAIAQQVVGTTATQTLTNKTFGNNIVMTTGYSIGLASQNIVFNSGSTGSGMMAMSVGTQSGSSNPLSVITGTLSTFGTPSFFLVKPTISQSSSGGFIALDINPIISTIGTGAKVLTRWQYNSGQVAQMDYLGQMTVTGFQTAFVTKTAAYTATGSDSVITGDATSATFAITLPTAVGIAGRPYTIKKIDSSANALTVTTTSSQTIDGSTTYSLGTQYKYVVVTSNGTNWLITGNN